MTAAELAADILSLGPDHRAALLVERRISKAMEGRLKYGPINLADDKRDFLLEALAEGIDKEWYLLFEIVKVERENALLERENASLRERLAHAQRAVDSRIAGAR